MDFIIKDKGKEIGRVEIDTNLRTWELDVINVSSDYQGQGIGTILLKAACAYADNRRKDLELVIGSSGPMSNDQLRDWYSRHGFQRINIGMRRPYREQENNDQNSTPLLRMRDHP